MEVFFLYAKLEKQNNICVLIQQKPRFYYIQINVSKFLLVVFLKNVFVCLNIHLEL